jgi:hypothetical protein
VKLDEPPTLDLDLAGRHQHGPKVRGEPAVFRLQDDLGATTDLPDREADPRGREPAIPGDDHRLHGPAHQLQTTGPDRVADVLESLDRRAKSAERGEERGRAGSDPSPRLVGV